MAEPPTGRPIDKAGDTAAMESSTPLGEPAPRAAAKKSVAKKSVAKKSAKRATASRKSTAGAAAPSAPTAAKRSTTAKKTRSAKQAQPAEVTGSAAEQRAADSADPAPAGAPVRTPAAPLPPPPVIEAAAPKPADQVGAPRADHGPGDDAPVTSRFHEPVVVDLGSTVLPIIAKRLVPVGLGLLAVLALVRLLRRRR